MTTARLALTGLCSIMAGCASLLGLDDPAPPEDAAPADGGAGVDAPAAACEGAPGAAELCNHADDDVDCLADEGLDLGAPCDSEDDADLCEDGERACDDQGGVICKDDAPDLIEACNLADDDCDSATDEEGACACGEETCDPRTQQCCPEDVEAAHCHALDEPCDHGGSVSG